MPDDDHEVIDSPAALLQHLYEAHGVQEARDANPTTAPMQFWLRKHDELERTAGQGGGPTGPPPTAPAATPAPAPAPSGPPSPPPAAPGPRYRPFADPLVEAAAAALVRRGLEERQVRRWIASHPAASGGRGGEDAVRASFLAPVLDAMAARIGGAGTQPTPTPASPPTPAARPPADGGAGAPAGAGPAGRPPAAGPPAAGPAPDLDADFMAIADVLQSRRRRTGRGNREPTPAAPRQPADDHDDYMALADAVQHRRNGTRR
jgi:hypothetical protein